MGLEPMTSGVTVGAGEIAPTHTDTHEPTNSAVCSEREFTDSHGRTRKSTPFATRLLPDLRDAEEALLSVKDVARRLGVHPYTVYKLCERGELPHVRVLNAIRVKPDDLARFASLDR
jgi:excisionase family DNA binding protein